MVLDKFNNSIIGSWILVISLWLKVQTKKEVSHYQVQHLSNSRDLVRSAQLVQAKTWLIIWELTREEMFNSNKYKMIIIVPTTIITIIIIVATILMSIITTATTMDWWRCNNNRIKILNRKFLQFLRMKILEVILEDLVISLRKMTFLLSLEQAAMKWWMEWKMK